MNSNELIILPDEGHGHAVYDHAAKLHHQTEAPILVSGATRDPEAMNSYGLKSCLERGLPIVPVSSQIDRIIDLHGVDPDAIHHEPDSQNTLQNAQNSAQWVLEEAPHVQQIHLVKIFFAMQRTRLTFKKSFQDVGLASVKITPHTIFEMRELKLFLIRLGLGVEDLLKIRKYRKLGHL